ncbi:MAG: glycosyl hydrolase, partial [Armatimonadota bacterium]
MYYSRVKSISKRWIYPFVGLLLFMVICGQLSAADARHIYGIHWWGHTPGQPVDTTPKTLLDVPEYSAWDTEIVLTHDSSMAASNFTGLFQALYGWNVSIITRIDYKWGEVLPAPSRPDYATWGQSIVSAINQLADWCHIWIIGNEPNLTLEANGWPDSKIQPSDYAAVYRNVRNYIRANARVGAAGPHIVLIAGPSPGPAMDVRWMSGTEYLDAVLANIPPSEVDGVAIHAYAGDINTFRNDYRSQLQVIDNRGCGSKPVWITEFNRRVSNDNDEQYSASFVRQAFDDVAQWNGTVGNHNIVGMTWFIYDSNQQAAGLWNPFAIEYWKDHGFPAGDSRDLFTAFQQAVDLRYPAGIYGTRMVPVAWSDEFNDGVLDQTSPEP